MRLTVDLDPDVHDFTSAYACAKGITLSEAVNEVIRRAEPVPGLNPPETRLKRSKHGYLVIAKTGHPITLEMVKELSEDELV